MLLPPQLARGPHFEEERFTVIFVSILFLNPHSDPVLQLRELRLMDAKCLPRPALPMAFCLVCRAVSPAELENTCECGGLGRVDLTQGSENAWGASRMWAQRSCF